MGFRSNKRQGAGALLDFLGRVAGEVRLVLVSGAFRRGVKERLGHCFASLF